MKIIISTLKSRFIATSVCLCIYMLIQTQAFAYGDYYKGSKRGWFWFEQSVIELDSNKDFKKYESDKSQKTAHQELKEFTLELDEAKAAMIMRPSINNTIRFIEYQNEMFAKADIVKINWQDALLVKPDLNIAREIPISSDGAKIRDRAELKDNKQLLQSFAKKFTLLFFYKGNCSYCTNFAHVLQVFANNHGFKVSSVAMDNKVIKGFKGYRQTSLIEKFNVKFVPSVFAYSEELAIAVPISSGFLAIDEFEKKAVYVASKLKQRLR